MFVGISAHCFGSTWTANMHTATLFTNASPHPCHFLCPTASIEVSVRAAEMMSQRIVMPPNPRGMANPFNAFSTSGTNNQKKRMTHLEYTLEPPAVQ